MHQASTLTTFKDRFIGDRNFYHRVFTIAIPIVIQNGISSFVSLLDNIMIGRVGTEQMSGAAIVNQLVWVYYLAIFGASSGAGIFTAQYFGQKDHEGVRQTTRIKIWFCMSLTAAAILLFLLRGNTLISLYLTGESEGVSAADTLFYGRKYLQIMLLGLPAFAMATSYASTLRECGETMLPMKAGITAVLVNLCFNYLLIYGKLGFPRMGVIGAAVATVLSRYVEMSIILIWTHTHKKKAPFAEGLYRTMRVSGVLLKRVIIKGMPLLANEAIWGTAEALLAQCYSVRGLNVVASMNICATISNLFGILFFSMGDAVAIMVGQLLGAGKMEEAKDTDNKLIAFSMMMATVTGAALLIVAQFFPYLYNTNAEARKLATYFIMVRGLFMPLGGFLHPTYFTLRSGGRTIITFIFDSGFICCVSVPIAYILSRFTAMPVVPLYAAVLASDFIKCFIGIYFLKKGTWMNNIVNDIG